MASKKAMEARARRLAAKDAIREAKVRIWTGYAGAYVGEAVAVQMFPSLTPDPTSPLNAVGGIVDIGLAGGGIYLALKRDDEVGDYATGAAMVGVTQLLDRVVGAVTTWLQNRATT